MTRTATKAFVTDLPIRKTQLRLSPNNRSLSYGLRNVHISLAQSISMAEASFQDALSSSSIRSLYLGVPLHRPGERPKAPCPICSASKGNREPKRLFGIRGWQEGNFDKNIPKGWFDTPPIRLESSESSTPEMEALRVCSFCASQVDFPY